MGSVTFKWSNAAFRAIRYDDADPRVITALENLGQSIMDEANASLPEGEGYHMTSYPGARKPFGRWQVLVYAGSGHAKRSDAIHNTLRKALGR